MIQHEPISAKEAARFFRLQFGGKLPAGFHWYAVDGITINTPLFDASYLIAGKHGLYGIVGFKDVITASVLDMSELAAG